jgi:hypothetical protein
MTGPRAPVLVARAAVGLAVRPLRDEDRARYRAEFSADLAALPPLGQLRYAAGVLSRAFVLRAALDSNPTGAEEAAMSAPARARVPFPRYGSPVPFWRCRVFRWHDFVRRSNPDGGLYQACRRCGLDRGPGGYGPMTTPPWPVGSAGA